MKIAITVGHSVLKNGACTSADGRKLGGVLEYKWCKNFSSNLKKALKKKGHDVTIIICPEKKFKSSSEEKTYKLGKLKGKSYDLVMELHLNAESTGKAVGCEVLYKTQKGLAYAKLVEKGLEKTFKGRGCKKRDDLYMLNATSQPAIIVESFFCTSKSDYKKGKGKVKRDKIAKDIAAMF